MSDLRYHLAVNGVIPLDDFLEATKRAVARCGGDLMMDEAGENEIARELYVMALEGPEGEVFV